MIELEIVTPEKRVVDLEVESVSIPTAKGEIGILPKHAPLISTLKSGILSYSEGNQTQKLVVSGGFVEISGNKVSILADTAETKDEIDLEAAKHEKDEVQKALGDWKGSEEEFEQEFERLERARARLNLGTAK